MLLTLLLLFSNSARGDEEAAIRAVLMNQQAAWNRGDIDGYLSGYWQSPKLRFASGAEVTYGYAETAARYRQRYDSKAKMGELKFELLEVQQLGEHSALVFGRWQLTRATDQPHGLFTLELEKFAEGWKVTRDHTSSGN
ncbi:DUF4440 domain-containing protein [Permianibacter sp. IMCC34836]|nr:DUF4440 domain-containing protein [Permianibacter fluminis]